MVTTWYKLIEDKPRDGAVNMAVDQYLLDLVDDGVLTTPVLRTYAWTKPTLSLGYHQKWQANVDMQAVERHDVSLVRRWTGGRAVLHDREITYAFVAPTEEPFKNRVSQNYLLLGRALKRFTDLGKISGQLALEEGPLRPKGMRNVPCFASVSTSEIEADGRKMIGSAQKLGRSGFLQHGSIPISNRLHILEEITGTTLDMSRYMTSLEDHFLEAGLVLPSTRELVARLVAAFEDEFQVKFVDFRESGLLDEAAIKKIAARRFCRDSWTYRK